MLANYGNEVEDFAKEQEELSSGNFGDGVSVLRQRDIPIGGYRKFWFAPIPKVEKPKKSDYANAASPAWRIFQHYVPLPAGSDKKGFVTICSGHHDVLRRSKGALDPDNCEVCKYIETMGVDSGRIDRKYITIGFNYSVRKAEIREWIEQGRNNEDEDEPRDPENFPASLWVAEWSGGLYDKIGTLREREGSGTNCLHKYKVVVRKSNTDDGKPPPMNVKYDVEFDPKDLAEPPEFSEMEWAAIRNFTEGVKNDKGEVVQVPRINYLIEATTFDRQMKKLALIDRKDGYSRNRFGEDRAVQAAPKVAKEKVGAASGRFPKTFAADDEDEVDA